MSEKKANIVNAFMVLVSVRIWLSMTSIFADTAKIDVVEMVFNLIIVVLFLYIVVSMKYKMKQLVIIGVLFSIFLLSSFLSNNRIFFLTYLVIVVSREIDKKKMIKIFLITNLCIYSMHILYYLICSCFDPSKIQYMIDEKGVRANLFLKHPNYAAGVMLWMMSMYIYVKENINKKVLAILIVIFSIVSYMITKSRTSLIGFVYLFVVSVFWNNTYFFCMMRKLIKYLFIILAVTNIFIFTNYDKYDFSKINDMFSGRFKQSYAAYVNYGKTAIGQKININDEIVVKGKYRYSRTMLDSFYSSCFINFGYLYLIIIGILAIKFNKKGTNKVDIYMWGLFATVCFCEKYVIMATVAYPLILMGRSFLVRNDEQQ